MIRSCLSQELKYDVMNETSTKKNWALLQAIFDKKRRESLAFEEEVVSFLVEEGV